MMSSNLDSVNFNSLFLHHQNNKPVKLMIRANDNDTNFQMM
jgi:hypothetical protein